MYEKSVEIYRYISIDIIFIYRYKYIYKKEMKTCWKDVLCIENETKVI